MKIILSTDILSSNQDQASLNRKTLQEHGVQVFNLISSPGSGKTTLLCQTIRLLQPELRVGVIEGDIFTARDAERISQVCPDVVQLNTRGGCHLDARMIAAALKEFDLGKIDILFIENVGNLVCPAEFDLGEDEKIAVLSVAEGDDKPEKYPFAFQEAAAVVINKTDLIPYTNFDIAYARAQIRQLQPDAPIFEISTPQETGFSPWIAYLRQKAARRRGQRQS